jgi:hypothetical protein
MFRYNLYVFDRAGGLVIEYHPFEAASHEAAIGRATDINAHCAMELWCDEALGEELAIPAAPVPLSERLPLPGLSQ